MKAKVGASLFVAFLMGSTVWAQDAAQTGYSFDKGFPTAATTEKAREDVLFQRAVTAYRFWYPTVSVEGIFNGNRVAGIKDNGGLGAAAAGAAPGGIDTQLRHALRIGNP
ncbi:MULTISPECIES: hypothetical protein [unclassified Rhizobium]|uniref:hypothetical protein n=1 Tax=unclassified Rhizobium TaxID=2613769 RepID=UPI001FD9D2DF|nr:MULTISPECIES: hypothetical protein [unclassified Rhizobium]